jgi:hypothetical protein
VIDRDQKDGALYAVGGSQQDVRTTRADPRRFGIECLDATHRVIHAKVGATGVVELRWVFDGSAPEEDEASSGHYDAILVKEADGVTRQEGRENVVAEGRGNVGNRVDKGDVLVSIGEMGEHTRSRLVAGLADERRAEDFTTEELGGGGAADKGAWFRARDDLQQEICRQHPGYWSLRHRCVFSSAFL